ncbi:MAG: hypothetical protein U0903_22380 [Planctomycetales bacterium]
MAETPSDPQPSGNPIRDRPKPPAQNGDYSSVESLDTPEGKKNAGVQVMSSETEMMQPSGATKKTIAAG